MRLKILRFLKEIKKKSNLKNFLKAFKKFCAFWRKSKEKFYAYWNKVKKIFTVFEKKVKKNFALFEKRKEKFLKERNKEKNSSKLSSSMRFRTSKILAFFFKEKAKKTFFFERNLKEINKNYF